MRLRFSAKPRGCKGWTQDLQGGTPPSLTSTKNSWHEGTRNAPSSWIDVDPLPPPPPSSLENIDIGNGHDASPDGRHRRPCRSSCNLPKGRATKSKDVHTDRISRLLVPREEAHSLPAGNCIEENAGARCRRPTNLFPAPRPLPLNLVRLPHPTPCHSNKQRVLSTLDFIPLC